MFCHILLILFCIYVLQTTTFILLDLQFLVTQYNFTIKCNHNSPNGWLTYFKKLLNIKKTTHNTDDTSSQGKGPLDFNFSREEIIAQIKSLKSNKSASTTITNEMLKSNVEIIAESLVRIFNFVLKRELGNSLAEFR